LFIYVLSLQIVNKMSKKINPPPLNASNQLAIDRLIIEYDHLRSINDPRSHAYSNAINALRRTEVHNSRTSTSNTTYRWRDHSTIRSSRGQFSRKYYYMTNLVV
jgi:hypothetical protein